MGRKPLLTKEEVLVALQRWTARNGAQPSVEELRRDLSVASTRTVFRYLQMLEEDGAIERFPGKPGVKLLKPRAEGAQTRAVPVVGRIPAGALMLAEENTEGWVHLPKALVSPPSGKFFLLRVRGTSMNRAGQRSRLRSVYCCHGHRRSVRSGAGGVANQTNALTILVPRSIVHVQATDRRSSESAKDRGALSRLTIHYYPYLGENGRKPLLERSQAPTRGRVPFGALQVPGAWRP